MTINSGFSHWKWWFSIATLNYQRVTPVSRDPNTDIDQDQETSGMSTPRPKTSVVIRARVLPLQKCLEGVCHRGTTVSLQKWSMVVEEYMKFIWLAIGIHRDWMGCTLWLFNIAMENGPFIDDLPMKLWFSIVMLVYQRVNEINGYP